MTNSSERGKRSNWAIDDNMKLLELVSSPGMSWEGLQEAFEGKKSIEDIILHFMQFPINNFAPREEEIKQKEGEPVDICEGDYVSYV